MSAGAAADPPTVAAAAARVAAALGGEVFFGLSGSGNFHLTHELRDAGLAYYAATHESSCVAMADGYARTAGTVGIATVHQGPGLTHATTALREAVRSHTPLVLFAASLPDGATEHNQYVDQVAVAASVGAAVEVLSEPDQVVADVARCFRRATAEGRPVVLMLPIDLQGERCRAEISLDPGSIEVPTLPAPSAAAIEHAAGVLEAARRPVFLAGRGAARSRAGNEIERLADAFGATLLTSTRANGLFRGHPRYLGLAGGFGSARARSVLAEADVVLVFGCSLNPWTLAGNQDLAAHARIVQVDSRPEALRGPIGVEVPIVADCAVAAGALLTHLRQGGGEPSRSPSPPLPPPPPEPASAGAGGSTGAVGDAIDPTVLTARLEQMLPAARTVSVDSGHFMVFPSAGLTVPDPEGFLLAQGFMSMGLGLAEGIGALVARPDRLGLVALGDGGAKMSIGELDTAVRHQLPLLVVVYNDAAFGAEVHDFEGSGRPLDTVRFRDVDFAALARGLGAEAITVRSPADLTAVEDWLPRRSRPLLVDAKVDPTVRGPWVD